MIACKKSIVSILAASSLLAATTAIGSDEKTYSPYANRSHPENVYWGDTHVHTNLSTDAYSFSNVNVSPEMAYRFARGESITSSSGQPVRLTRPLDFLLVSDHAEFLGVFPLLAKKDPAITETNIGKHWSTLFDEGKYLHAFAEVMQVKRAAKKLDQDPEFLQSMWQQVTAAADKYNQPGVFTAFIGYEWTSMPTGNNLHRNMIFRDDASKANQITPFSAIDSHNPEDLWQFLEDYETKTGGRVLAISHNGNGSNGAMFSDKTYEGNALTAAYAETRMRWEPIAEVTQIKGDGEAHPYLSPDDEFADYETWDFGNFGGIAKENTMLRHEYARSALKLGLALENQLGANPYKFGMIGSSDSHTSLAAIEEDNFFGKFSNEEPDSHRAEIMQPMAVSTYAASGYAAVWAHENTRESLFEAMQRRETYATTGPRMMVRFFGGWDFEQDDDLRPNYAAIGYQKGVPMGGDLSQAPNNKAPQFMVIASKDAMGANLDRVQIIKGWLDSEGQAQEKIYHVALSDQRKVSRRTGKVKPLPSTVDLATATYTNSVGAAQLSTVWSDPEFNASQRAFYYVRVLEIATPRWTTYDAAFYNSKRPSNVPAIIQERAYTSPIWYTP